MRYIFYFFSLLLLLPSCRQENEDLPIIENVLSDYIAINTDFPLVRDSLIACAFGGQIGFLENENNPVSILFLPEGTATDFRYFETDSIEVNPDDLSNYHLQELPVSPIFAGFLQRFDRPSISKNLWGRVTFVKEDQLYISNAIRLKFDDKPTEFSSTLVRIDQTDNLSPIFSWTDGRIPENQIYFHAVLDEQDNLISGTYTFEQQFQFYNLSNVVLNIRDVTPPPALLSNDSYQFVLMGVSIDNWVNLIARIPFETN